MKVLLVPLYPKKHDAKKRLPNLALMKIAAWHLSLGDQVSFDEQNPNVAYFSSPFKLAHFQAPLLPADCWVEMGGYGFNDRRLPDAVEHTMPAYELFGIDYSLGHTTMGCIRNCWFCVVPQMEGSMRTASPIEEFHCPSHKKVVLLDNNILALPAWFKRNAEYIIEQKLVINITQGIDIRLVSETNAQLLAEIKHEGRIHLAFDSWSYADEVVAGIQKLLDAGIKRYQLICYCLGVPGKFDDCKKRVDHIISWGIDPFVMLLDGSKADRQLMRLARWCNRPAIRKTSRFEEYRRL